MLAPVTETTFTEHRLLQLNLASLSRYPDFVAELEAVSGLPAGLRRRPTSHGLRRHDGSRCTFALSARAGHPGERDQRDAALTLLAPRSAGAVIEGDGVATIGCSGGR